MSEIETLSAAVASARSLRDAADAQYRASVTAKESAWKLLGKAQDALDEAREALVNAAEGVTAAQRSGS